MGCSRARWLSVVHDTPRNAGYRDVRKFPGIECRADRQPRTNPVYGPPPNYVATYEAEETVRWLECGLWKSFGPGSYFPV